METAGLLLNTFLALSVVFYILFIAVLVAIYFFRLALIYLPFKKVTVYTRKNGKAVKIKMDEYVADLLWGDEK